jgi:hypothetical protein
MPPFLPIALAAVAAVYARREWRRVNEELDRLRGKSVPPIATLRRDATTGEWRPSR